MGKIKSLEQLGNAQGLLNLAALFVGRTAWKERTKQESNHD